MCSLYLGDQIISGQTTLVGESRNIGQIIPSAIPLTDAGVHLLDGALINGSGIYSDFVNYIAGIYDPTANYFCTESEWQTSVTQYGVCGKFVYDSVNNTVRLPKYNSKIYTGGGTAPVIGNGMTLGLSSRGNNYGIVNEGDSNYIYADGNVYGQPAGTYPGRYVDDVYSIGVTTDPTKSGLIAQISNITTSLDGYYYIVIATSTKTDIQVDIDEIATDLNGKADVDLSNVTDTGYIKMAGASMPSGRYINLPIGASGTTYTAPANGYFVVDKRATGAQQYININRTSTGGVPMCGSYTAYASGVECWALQPVLKGDNVRVNYTCGGALEFFRFIYAQGSESEAS